MKKRKTFNFLRNTSRYERGSERNCLVLGNAGSGKSYTTKMTCFAADVYHSHEPEEAERMLDKNGVPEWIREMGKQMAEQYNASK